MLLLAYVKPQFFDYLILIISYKCIDVYRIKSLLFGYFHDYFLQISFAKLVVVVRYASFCYVNDYVDMDGAVYTLG